MVVFDATKPSSNSRFNSEELRNNFTALSRANDLRCSASDPPDLNINVASGTFSTITTSAVAFAGGSIAIDTTTGGLATQERIFAVEIDATGTLVVNNSAAWALPSSATVPLFTIGNIALCTVLVTFGDTEILQSQITDVRPIINLGTTVIATGLAFADLSDIDGNQSAAFQASDSPTALNPFLTPTTAPIPTILSDITTLQNDLTDHFSASSNRHTAADIDAVDNFTFTNETNVQGVLDDIENSIYQAFLAEHESSGVHGPKVTITQTNADNALEITHSNVTFSGSVVNVVNNGTGNAVNIEQNSTTTSSVLNVVATEDLTGSEAVVEFTMESDFGEVLHVQNTLETHNSGQRVAKFTQAGQGGTVLIQRSNTNSETSPTATLHITDSTPIDGPTVGTGARSLLVQTTGGGTNTDFPGSRFRGDLLGPTVEINASGGGQALHIEQTEDVDALFLNKTGVGAGDVIDITNSGTGFDIRGNLARWSVDSMGHSSFGNVQAGSGTGVVQGFLVLNEGAVLVVSNPDGLITPTHSYHEVQANSGTTDNVDNIEVSGVPDGAILILKPSSGHAITLREQRSGSGEMYLNNTSNQTLNNDDRITLQKDGTAWYQIAPLANLGP